MGSGTVGKIILCIITVLVLTQLLFYNVLQTRNAAHTRYERDRLTAEIQRLSQRKTELQQDLAGLQQEYDQVVASVPRQILSGYEDREVMLASFLDYIKSPAFDKVKAKVSMQGVQKFIEKPVPVLLRISNAGYMQWVYRLISRRGNAQNFQKRLLGM